MNIDPPAATTAITTNAKISNIIVNNNVNTININLLLNFFIKGHVNIAVKAKRSC